VCVAMGWMPDKSLNPSTIYSNHLMNLSEQTIGKWLLVLLSLSLTGDALHWIIMCIFLTHNMMLRCDKLLSRDLKRGKEFDCYRVRYSIWTFTSPLLSSPLLSHFLKPIPYPLPLFALICLLCLLLPLDFPSL
jgi:hypothetical protein